MYLRPGNLLKDFTVEKATTNNTQRGRKTTAYDTAGDIRLLAVLAEAKPEEVERFRQQSHPITHTITQRGRPKAKAGDRLVHGGRYFYIQGVDDVGELGITTIYYAEERSDLDGDNP